MFRQLLTAAGLSGASGLRLHLPLLILGLAARFTHAVSLPAQYEILANTYVLIALGVLTAAEFIGDKIPIVDHGLHLVGTVLNPAVGGFVFMATSSGDLPPYCGALAGIFIAGTTHAVRASVRPAATVGTAGIANPFLSLSEDLGSIVLAATAIFLPVVAGILLLLMFGIGALVLRKVLKSRKAKKLKRLQSSPS